MKLPVAIAFAVMISGSAGALAQDSIAGTYNGNYEVYNRAGKQTYGVTLVINSVEDGKVKGTATYHQGSCRGDYPVEGTLKDGVVGVRATAKGGPSGDCSFGFKGKVDGNRLVGNMGKYDVELRK
jgi:hypothetical protein